MASIGLFTSVDMRFLTSWFGTVTSYSSSHITITNGALQGSYFGRFSYDIFGSPHGTLTGFEQRYSGLLQISASGLSTDAYNAAQWVNSNQLQRLLQSALAGNDAFTVTSGTHVIDGYGGYNVLRLPQNFANYNVVRSGGAVVVSSGSSHETLYNVQGVRFADGFYDVQGGRFMAPGTGFSAQNVTTGGSMAGTPRAYGGPVVGLQSEFVSLTPDKLAISVATPGWFIHSGSGDDAIAVSSGVNVLDGGTGSNFLTGSFGEDTFFVDAREPTADIWSTVTGMSAGDAATVWGVSPSTSALTWADNMGAPGYTGLTFHASTPGRPNASLTIAGYSQGDLSSGRLSASFGFDPGSGSSYAYLRANY